METPMRRMKVILTTPDEDIPTIVPSPLRNDDKQVAAKKKSNDEIRIGPITRARA
jgi:hypothetical protein